MCPESITIYSQNARGLAATDKRRDVFHMLREKGYHIVCLQDIHINSKMVEYVKSEWGCKALFSPYTSSSRGVCILFNKNFDFKIHDKKQDPNGNYLLLDITIEGSRCTLVTIYGPNRDEPDFYDNLKKNILKLNDDNPVVICGDWNLVLNPKLDLYNYVNVNNPRARDKVIDIMGELQLLDIWRIKNNDIKKYTWRQSSYRKQSRLDFFLVSETFIHTVLKADIVPGYRTDHSGILLKLKINENERGPGYWKFNCSLLKDKEYVKMVKETIEEVKTIYNNNNNNKY